MSNHNDSKIQTNLLGRFPGNKLDPATLRFVQEYFILDNLAVKLVYLSANESYENELAESITFSESNKTIQIKLKMAYYSDGSLITATDVAKSFKRAIINGAPHIDIDRLFIGASSLKHINDSIQGIKVIDSNTLELNLVQPTKEILFYFTLTDLAILHKSQYEKDNLQLNDWSEVTSGPYRLKLGDDSNGPVELIANKKSFNYSHSMPQTVELHGYKNDNIMQELEKSRYDFGTINFKDYYKNVTRVNKIEKLQILESQTDGITHIDLNLKSGLFSKVENRQWVQKKILDNFKVIGEFKAAAQKSHQFFPPGAKGHIKLKNTKELLKNVEPGNIPEDLKGGFTIKSVKGMKYYLPEGLDKTLSEILGIKVKIDLSVDSKDYLSFKKDRTFDATIISTSMSYKVLGEALNLQYMSESPSFLDPTGKIKKLMRSYQSKENLEEEHLILNKILTQMVIDSECIPLFYFTSPFFVNHKKLNVDNVNLDESVKFYKMEML